MRIVTYNVYGLQGYPAEEAVRDVGELGSEARIDHFVKVFAELDADIIGFIYRDEVYHDDTYTNPEEIGKADLRIAKHRNGATGNIKLAFVGQYSRFEDLAFEDRFQGVSDDQMDASYINNMTNFDQGDF